MDLAYEDSQRWRLNGSVVRRGKSAIEDRVPEPERALLVVARNFDESVQSRLPAEASSFSSSRGAGFTPAKTMATDDVPSVVVRSDLFEPGARSRFGLDPIRICAHEAGHVAILQRGEPIEDRLSEVGYFEGIAGRMIEEYRAERPLCAQGWWPDNDLYRSGLPNVFTFFRSRAVAAYGVETSSSNVPPEFLGVTSAFRVLAGHLAYIAADVLAGDDRDVGPSATTADWQRLVGGHWNELLNMLQPLPPASVSSSVADLEATGRGLSDPVHAWFRFLGFDLSDDPIRFEILRRDL